jgi:iron complex outermembrane receptor protein
MNMKTVHHAAPAWALALICVDGARAEPDAADEPRPEETIVVVGTEAAIDSARAEIALTPGGATLIDLSALGEQNVASLADGLRYVPGVWSGSDTGNDGIFLSSRGSNLDATDYDMNGIKLLQDGLPVTTADGNNHNRIVDPLAARYATFARGANAMSYGASTLGGAVNFVTPTVREGEVGSVSLTGGSHGQALGRLTLGSRFGESADGMFTLETKRWDGYRVHNEQERSGVYANVGWEFGDEWSTRFYLTAIENDQELPGSLTRAELDADPDQANAAAVIGNYQLDVDTERVANRTSWQIDADRRLELGVSLETQSLYHPIVWTPFFTLLIDSDHRDIGTMLRYSHSLRDHELVVGFNYGENDVDGGNYGNDGGRPAGLSSLVRNEASTAELFALDRWRVTDRTTLIVAAQAVAADRDARTTAVPSGVVTHPRASYDRINPRVGFVRSVGGGASFYGNLSRLFEPPTNFELEDNADVGATLDPMRGSVVEIGARGDFARGAGSALFWDVSAYYATIDDEILSVEDPNAPGTSLVTNIDNTIHAGIEVLFGGRFGLGSRGGSIEPRVAVSFNEFAFDGDPVYGDKTLPAAPVYFLRGELIYRSADGLFFGPTVDRVGKRWADFANTYRIEGHTVWGLRAGWAQGRWRAFADIRNLADEDYVVTHSVRNVAAANAPILNPGEPLSVYLGVERRLE